MMKKVVGTVCSANHLAYAKTMADSFLKYNPDYTIVICLVDKIESRFNVSEFAPYTIIEVEQLNIPQFERMSAQYSIIELNCAVKPYLCQYIFNTSNPDLLLYMDSDLLFFNSVKVVEDALINDDIVITPHSFTPINDDFIPMERDFLRSGIYNAGFVGMKKSTTTTNFLNWWAEKLIDQSFINFAEGMCFDQNWLNFLPLYYQHICILNHKGFNAAYWNFHEREITQKEGQYFVNNTEPLVFLHISGYKFHNPDNLSVHQTRFQLKNLPVVVEILNNYRTLVTNNGYEQFINLKCFYAKPKKKSTGIMPMFNKIIGIVGLKLSKI